MKIKTIAAAAIFAVIGATSASASTVNLSKEYSSAFGPQGWYETITRTIDGDVKTLRAGAFRFTDGISSIIAFCIEPGVYWNLAEAFDTEATPDAVSANAMTNIDKLFTSAYDLVVDATTAAAFQIALWEVIVEDGTGNGFDLGSGDHTVDNSAASFAVGNSFLAGLANASTGGYMLTTYVNSGQDQISATPVPLPASAMLLLGGMGGLAALRRKKVNA